MHECELVETVDDGQSLLVAFERWNPDIVLTDISMPVLNGMEACRRLHETAPHVKVILVSAYSDAAYVTAAFQTGASGYVLKHHAALECFVPFERRLTVGSTLHLRSTVSLAATVPTNRATDYLDRSPAAGVMEGGAGSTSQASSHVSD